MKFFLILCNKMKNDDLNFASSSDDELTSKPVNISKPKTRAEELFEIELVNKWKKEQSESQKRLQLFDTEPWQINRSIYAHDVGDVLNEKYQNEHLRYVAGMDISFVKDADLACSGLFVFDLSDKMKLVYEDLDTQPITMDVPYAPGYLAYREAPFLLPKLARLKTTKPHLYPHCIFIDGNGCLHENGFGMACHIGLESQTPTIGVSKKLFQVCGLENNAEHKARIKSELKKGGDHFELRGKMSSSNVDDGLLAYCYRSTDDAANPVYVSLGDKIGWSTCLWLLARVITKYRIPEPIRHADIRTREYLRNLNNISTNVHKK